jgi:hypothetical protein
MIPFLLSKKGSEQDILMHGTSDSGLRPQKKSCLALIDLGGQDKTTTFELACRAGQLHMMGFVYFPVLI